ncbi:MAG: CDP-alcohol phosphatidyltransferase family protein [Candidatus Thorarchaeota archaeon]
MTSKLRLRRLFKPGITLFAKLLSKMGVSPNLATVLMLLFAILSSISLTFFNNYIFCALFIFMTGIFDGIDGAIARYRNKNSFLGGFLDSVMDRFSEFIIFFGFLIFFDNKYLWNIIDMRIVILISLLSSIMISYMRTRGETLVKGDFDVGLMARSERLFFLFLSFLLANFFGYINELLFLFMILVLLSALYRFFKIKSIIEQSEKNHLL